MFGLLLISFHALVYSQRVFPVSCMYYTIRFYFNEARRMPARRDLQDLMFWRWYLAGWTARRCQLGLRLLSRMIVSRVTNIFTRQLITMDKITKTDYMRDCERWRCA